MRLGQLVRETRVEDGEGARLLGAGRRGEVELAVRAVILAVLIIIDVLEFRVKRISL